MVEKKINITLSYDSTEFPADIIQSIFEADNNTVMSPVEINSQFFIFYKYSEQGERIKSLDEVIKILTEQLQQDKLNTLKNDFLEKLKKKYPIENYIDYSKYLH